MSAPNLHPGALKEECIDMSNNSVQMYAWRPLLIRGVT